VTLVLLAEVRKDAFWIRSFVKAYGRVPRIWGLHTYGDANRRSNSRLARFVKAWPSGKIWITETATWEHFADTFTPSTARQAQLVPWAFRPALSYPRRVDRLYWYQWRGPSSANARWDSGLLDSDGTLRPVYEAVKRERFRSLR
jgi:hypothetical protein